MCTSPWLSPHSHVLRGSPVIPPCFNTSASLPLLRAGRVRPCSEAWQCHSTGATLPRVPSGAPTPTYLLWFSACSSSLLLHPPQLGDSWHMPLGLICLKPCLLCFTCQARHSSVLLRCSTWFSCGSDGFGSIQGERQQEGGAGHTTWLSSNLAESFPSLPSSTHYYQMVNPGAFFCLASDLDGIPGFSLCQVGHSPVGVLGMLQAVVSH